MPQVESKRRMLGGTLFAKYMVKVVKEIKNIRHRYLINKGDVMTAKSFSFYGGIILLALGLISIIPGFEGDTSSLPVLNVNLSYGLFLGLFAMNIVSKVFLIVVGASGVLVSRKNDLQAWIYYSRFIFFIMGVLAILGVPASTNSLNGFYPLFGNMILLNALFALVGGYCGFLWYRKELHSHRQTHA